MKAQAIPRPIPAIHHILWLLVVAFLAGALPAQALTLTPEEQRIANLLTGNSGQRRDKSQMRPDDRLMKVARARAMDMAKRRYFDHVNPDGVAANYLIRATGYQLPSFWSTSPRANNVESIGAGYSSADQAWSGWMGSSSHKTHLLASETFYRDQTSFGIGYYYDSSSPYKHYWVVITAPPSPTATLTIATPSAGAKVTAPSITMKGSVSGSQVFNALQYRVETPAGAGAWNDLSLPAGTGVGSFTANVSGLKPGSNTVRLRAVAANSSLTREVTRAVKVVVMKPLVVSIEGDGAVTPGFEGTTDREVGAPFTIVATASPGSIFSHWTGLPAGRNPFLRSQTLLMEEGLSLAASFIVDPYPALSSAYAGLFNDTSPSHQNSGSLQVRLARGGSLTGSLFYSGRRFALRGRFNAQGDAFFTILQPAGGNLVLTLHIDITGTVPGMTGTLSDGTSSIALSASRADAAVAATQFNVRIAPDANPATPRGFGFATVKISATGAVAISGLLADGTPINTGSVLAGGEIPVYMPLLGGAGSLTGTLAPVGSELQGSFACRRPARPGTRFPDAFDIQNAVQGSVYVRPSGEESAVSGGNFNLEINAPDLASPLTLAFTVAAKSKVSYLSVPPAGWRFTISPATGRFSGTYMHPALPGVKSFRGIIDQPTSSGFGFALLPSQSAPVTFQ